MSVSFFLFLWASGTCCSVTAPETSCMQPANIKRFVGRTAVGCIAEKQKSPGLSPLGLFGKGLVSQFMLGGTSVLNKQNVKLFPVQEDPVTETKSRLIMKRHGGQ